ncbi:YobI family P-loop NTPase [Leclercia adecarboxylata]|uniref:Pcar n=1 Tax=Leclercia adecarboxylata TaxID=83655 RepID=A0ABU6I2H5_9ENTR|nr:DUF1002 domain-containing protein [Leclercia adecarboxylata]MDV5240680.1 pcar [Leclercia adecarboxylata]MDV5277243.1 pcar [Leclercia adecarboxylata]MDV5460172.1 pcar [Leclercia adecarboxylata]MDV5504679.1 pcar [Leclercia adecarboxylata]MDV5532737.1 pcar [Leclercia adecarboxylata]
MMKTPRLAGLLALVKAKHKEKKTVTYDYDALTPSLMNEEDAQHYVEALNFACHRADIKNIAVTGPYGSGKSSVLLTWSKRREQDLKIMTVSLADFDMVRATDEIGEPTSEGSVKSERKARQEEKSIEYSILQQILYKARKSELPYSRIERIADVTPSERRMMAVGLLAMVSSCLSGFVLLFPDYFRKKLSLATGFSEAILQIPPVIRIGLLAGGAFFITSYLILSKLHRIGIFDRRMSIEKIDLSKGATISTRPSDTSLLNVFIDEIVYFFEKQKYNVVIFEDLDRHNDGAIFIKLREINQIINNSLPAEHPVRFIYAVRDDIFNSPEARTKFFDFVIPIIPVMDSQNATERFSLKFKKSEIDSPGFEQCIARLAIFIPDMRVLNSIANEFRLYRNLVNNGENIIRLLSLIAYKNLCARDYHLIDAKQGILHGIMNAHISGKLRSFFEEEITKDINDLKNQISEVNNESENDKSNIIKDILQVYISDNTKQQLHFSNQNGSQFSLDQIINDEDAFFTMLKTPGLYVKLINHRISIANISPAEADKILSEYNKRCKLLFSKSDGKIYDLQKKLEKLQNTMGKLLISSPGDLIQRMGNEGFKAWVNENLGISCGPDKTYGYDTSQFDFIYSLLRWEYLSTDYMSYRSVFIPGSLSSSDNDFVRAVSAGREHAITAAMPLEKTANVIKKLKEIGLLLHDNAWHASVLLHMLKYEKIELMKIIQLQLEDSEGQKLVQLYDCALCDWQIADSIQYVQLIAFDIEKTSQLLKLLLNINHKKTAIQLVILLFCSSSIRWNHTTTDMKYAVMEIMSKYEDVPDLVPDGYIKPFLDNLKNTGVKLECIGECNTAQGKEIINKIAELKLWKYSKENFESIFHILLDRNTHALEQFVEKPLSTIKKMKNLGLYETVQENIGSFISDFFLRSLDYDRVPEILNDQSIDFDSVHQVISEMEFTIDSIKLIKNRTGIVFTIKNLNLEKSIYVLLLDYNRINLSWSNVIYLTTQDEELNPEFSLWFDRNHSGFSDSQVSSSFDVIDSVFQKLFNCGAMSNEGRKKILKIVGLSLITLPDYMDFESTLLLIEENRLAPSIDNFKKIAQTFEEEGDRLTPLLANLVLLRPSLLQTNTEIILVNDEVFNLRLTERLLSDERLPKAIRIHSLNWLWGYDPNLFEGPLFIMPEILGQVVSGLTNDDIRRALLIQCLRYRKISHETTALVLNSLADADYQVFLSAKTHRSVVYTEPLRNMADLLASCGFIQSLKLNDIRGRIRFIPHNSPAFRHN